MTAAGSIDTDVANDPYLAANTAVPVEFADIAESRFDAASLSSPLHENWHPLSQMRCLGGVPALAIVLPGKAPISSEVGGSLNTAQPMARPEK